MSHLIVELTGSHLAFDQVDVGGEFRFPDVGVPQSEASDPFFGQHAPYRFTSRNLDQGIPHFGGYRESKPVVERPLEFTGDEVEYPVHASPIGCWLVVRILSFLFWVDFPLKRLF